MWKLGYSPICTNELDKALQNYPNTEIANLLSEGFRCGFKLHYDGSRVPYETKNLEYLLHNTEAAIEKVENEIVNDRIADPFQCRPISNLRCSPIGLVPKKTSSWRLITHVSCPHMNSVNDFIDSKFATVHYSSFDNAVSIVKILGENARIAKMDIKSAFRLLTCYPGEFNLLGFKIGSQYYIDKCMPMGSSTSCSAFEMFSTFLHWLTQKEAGLNTLDHYLDDFFLAGKTESNECEHLMATFTRICKTLTVPIAVEKTEGPSCIMEFLGLTINSIDMTIQIPEKKLKELLTQIKEVAYSKKVTLKTLQSLCGILSFCTRAMPAGRAFSMATSKAKKTHHLIRVTKEMFNDFMIWKMFIENFNGTFFKLDDIWVSNFDLQLYTDSAGGVGKVCAWMLFQW